MLRKFFDRAWPWAAMGAALGLFLLWAGSFLFDLAQEKCSEGATAYYGQCPRYNLAFVGLWNFIETTNWISPAITGVATALLTYVTVLLFRIEREGGDTTRAQLRAYVGIVDSSIEDFFSGRSPTVYIAIRNNGQTPAYDFYANLTVLTGPYPWPEKIPTPNGLVNLVDGKLKFSNIGIGVLIPTHKTHLSETLGIKVSAEELAKIKKGERALYAYGFAKYRDAFDRYWHLEYRYFSGGPGSTDRLYDDQTTEKQTTESDHRSLLSLAGAEFAFPSPPPPAPAEAK